MGKHILDRAKVREGLIRGGVNNLGAFGYPNVRPENILTDPIYSAFFKNMLEENLGQDEGLDVILREMMAECVGLAIKEETP